MSAHNGLLTHHEQAKYYGLVKNLVLVLQKRILRFYQARPCNEHKFVHILHRLIDQITHIEYINTTEPTFGDSLTELF